MTSTHGSKSLQNLLPRNTQWVTYELFRLDQAEGQYALDKSFHTDGWMEKWKDVRMIRLIAIGRLEIVTLINAGFSHYFLQVAISIVLL